MTLGDRATAEAVASALDQLRASGTKAARIEITYHAGEAQELRVVLITEKHPLRAPSMKMYTKSDTQ